MSTEQTPAASTSELALGFSDPVREAQATFKAVMWAVSRPGHRMPLATNLKPPAPLTPEMAALALALADYETPLWLDPMLAKHKGVADFLRFHTGAPITDDPAAARFALVREPGNLPPFTDFAQGIPEYPDRSTTLILAVTMLSDAPFTLEGPGIKSTRSFGATPLPADFATRWADNRLLFPLGVDLLFTTSGLVSALPRSTRITAEA
ncbi:carbon-phosphorus lyase subunit PhnH [Azorhizobium oxalatiphilum]|uniref:Carbon-phosphorus lyase subunit PhnH n=1 Tax=Azorhizobium oxalatiphilum TaxID=980631 RepID=A0A917BN57_9HYPH|nr:phosphonate C-P lyase system protein PhnH [Azorhizobium oxalatiphilum]GGF49537.1 carbon-phosphorus lyase subunit PhnH [Azorhizobium oxalatiphilum]